MDCNVQGSPEAKKPCKGILKTSSSFDKHSVSQWVSPAISFVYAIVFSSLHAAILCRRVYVVRMCRRLLTLMTKTLLHELIFPLHFAWAENYEIYAFVYFFPCLFSLASCLLTNECKSIDITKHKHMHTYYMHPIPPSNRRRKSTKFDEINITATFHPPGKWIHVKSIRLLFMVSGLPIPLNEIRFFPPKNKN